MIDFEPQGVIYDIDDTLMDNGERANGGQGLHERSRLIAVHAVGHSHGLEELINYSAELNMTAFRRARLHNLAGALWVILQDTGVVKGDEVDVDHPVLQAIQVHRDEVHIEVIRQQAQAVRGSMEFVRAMHELTGGHQAVATGGSVADTHAFLEKMGIKSLFPDERIITGEHITRAKPDPEVFDLAFQSLGLPEGARAHTIAFEDDPRGIASAKGARLYVGGITSRFDPHELEAAAVPPDFIGQDYYDFAEQLGIQI